MDICDMHLFGLVWLLENMSFYNYDPHSSFKIGADKRNS